MFHPGVAQIDCRDCQKYVYDFVTGKRKTYAQGKRDRPRPASTPPPCHKCPKESPEKAHEHELSAKNWRTLALYQQVRASSGACLSDEMKRDALLMKNLATIDALFRRWEREQQAVVLATEIVRLGGVSGKW